jgi:hypothetical protein
MSPGAISFAVAGVLILAGIAAGAWADANFLRAWYYVLPVAAMLWVFVAGALAVPILGLLKLAKRSKIAYVLVLLTLGAAIGGGIGMANAVVVGGIIVGALTYAIAASIVVWRIHEN